jgi:hypothetical protein
MILKMPLIHLVHRHLASTWCRREVAIPANARLPLKNPQPCLAHRPYQNFSIQLLQTPIDLIAAPPSYSPWLQISNKRLSSSSLLPMVSSLLSIHSRLLLNSTCRQTNPRQSPPIPPNLPLRSARPPTPRTPQALERALLLHVDVRPPPHPTSTRAIPRRSRLRPPTGFPNPISQSVLADNAEGVDEH